VPSYRRREIDTPDGEWLSLKDAAGYLGLLESEFMERVRLRVFPPGTRSNMRERQWSWQTIIGISLLRPWLDRLYVRRKKRQAEQRNAMRRARRRERRAAGKGRAKPGDHAGP